MATAKTKKRRRRRKKGTLPKIQYRKAVTTLLLLSVAAFTIAMIVIFLKTGSVPDTLVTAFFAFAGGEAGFLGLIKYGDTKYTNDTDANSSDAGNQDTPAG